LSGERLGLDDEGGSLGDRGGDGGLALFVLLLGQLAHGAAQGLESALQRGEVAHGVGRGDRRRECLDRFRDVGSRGGALGALFEERHLAGQFDVLALEVRECFFWAAVGILTYGALA
jgi:hypothetical protein